MGLDEVAVAASGAVVLATGAWIKCGTREAKRSAVAPLAPDLRLRRNFILSLQLGYANLNGRDGRENNLLPMFVLERRLRLGSHLDLSIPIKGAVGFLPFNGPVLRISAGLAYAIGERVEITADLLAPSFWLIDDDIFVSMNLSLGIIVRL